MGNLNRCTAYNMTNGMTIFTTIKYEEANAAALTTIELRQKYINNILEIYK